jgi:threonine dehydratase
MLPKMSTMADGIAVGKPGDVPFKIIQQHVDEIRTVSEASLARALLLTLERSKLQVEAGGIAAVAAILDDPDSFDGPVVASLSGGNIDPLLLSRVLRTGLATSGRFLMVQVRLSDQPGSLAKLLACVAELGTNIIQTSHTRMNPALAISEVDVELELETRGFEHRDQILAQIVANGFEIVTYY